MAERGVDTREYLEFIAVSTINLNAYNLVCQFAVILGLNCSIKYALVLLSESILKL